MAAMSASVGSICTIVAAPWLRLRSANAVAKGSVQPLKYPTRFGCLPAAFAKSATGWYAPGDPRA